MSSYITRAVTEDGSARIIFADTTQIVTDAASIHQTSKTMTAALGRSLTAAALMGSLLKDKDNTLTFQLNGGGPAGKIVCVSDYKGNVRGYAENPQIELMPNSAGKLDVGGAVGKDGNLTIIKDMGMGEPYVGMCPLVSGEIGDDVTQYFATSEQTPTICALGVRVNQDHTVKSSGGFLLQVLPGAEDAVIDQLEKNMKRIPSVSAMIAQGKRAEAVIAAVLQGIEYQLFDEFDIGYVCSCSRERYLSALAGLPPKDLDELAAQEGSIEACCHFCNKKYQFDMAEIRCRKEEMTASHE